MKCFFSAGVALLLAVQLAAGEKPGQAADRIAHFHFLGVDQIQQTQAGSALREILALPETLEWWNEIRERLARLIEEHLPQALQQSNARGFIRPVLDQLLTRETYFEARPPEGEFPALSFAIQLDRDHSAIWETNLWRIFNSIGMPPQPVQAEEFPAHEIRTRSLYLRFSRAADWMVIEASPRPPQKTLLSEIERSGRPVAKPEDYFLSGAAEPSRIPVGNRAFFPRNLDSIERLELSVRRQEELLRTEGRVEFARPQGWVLEPWLIPTNSIRDPLISFTALQSLRPRLADEPLIRSLGLPQTPNQLFLWGLSPEIPLQFRAAVFVGDAGKALGAIEEKVVPHLSRRLLELGLGRIQSPRENHLAWHGLPLIIPHIEAAAPPEPGFLVGGILPVAGGRFTNPPPAELIAQLNGRKDLLYYDWEITQLRLVQLRELLPFLSIFTTIPMIEPNSAGARWLDAVEPRLGNTITEVTVNSPSELGLVRTSHLGWNGTELLGLVQWLSHPCFPRFPEISFRDFPKGKADQPPPAR